MGAATPIAAAATGTARLATATTPPACLRTERTSPRTDRVSGADRFATAACAAELAYPDGASDVIIARGDDAGGYADALAGTILAAHLDAPILLTWSDELPEPTAAELRRLAPERITVLGGTLAVSSSVEDQLRAIAPVERISGADRATTAARISARAASSDIAYLVNGHRPADALVAGGVAARAGAALLLVEKDALPRATDEALRNASEVVIVGGPGVVSTALEAHLVARFGSRDVRRLGGADRSETAASVARAHAATLPAAAAIHLVSARDRHLVDAISAGWLTTASGEHGPVLYAEVDAPTRGTDRWLRLGGLGSDRPVRLVGGSTILSDALVASLDERRAEAASGGPPPQLRGMWIHLFDSSLKTPEGIEAVLDAATSANMNALFVQVVRRHDAYYRAGAVPRTPDPAIGDLDLLARLLPAAHARGLEVHAWFVTMNAYHGAYDELVLPPGHVWREHGPGTSEPWLTVRSDGATSTYLEPALGGVQDHVVAMIRDVVERYDVDGVHLDYQRYPNSGPNGEWGFHPTATARFTSETGRTAAVGDPVFADWRRRQVTELTRRIVVEVADVDPTVPVSVAAIAQGPGPSDEVPWTDTRAHRDTFQDWAGWISDDLLDLTIPMDYFDDTNPEHAGWFDRWAAFAGSLRTERIVATGLGPFMNPLDSSLRQYDVAIANTDGTVLFSYQQDSIRGERGDLLARLVADRWADPAPTPPMPWRESPDEGHAVVSTTASRPVTLYAAGSTTPLRTIRADGSGRATFTWLAPGAYRAEAYGSAPVLMEVRAGEVTRAALS